MRFIYAIAAKNAGVDPAAARGRTIGFQFGKTIYLRAVMRIAVVIVAENDSAWFAMEGPQCPMGTEAFHISRVLPAVDFSEHGFHFRIAQLIFRIPPIQRA